MGKESELLHWLHFSFLRFFADFHLVMEGRREVGSLYISVGDPALGCLYVQHCTELCGWQGVSTPTVAPLVVA